MDNGDNEDFDTSASDSNQAAQLFKLGVLLQKPRSDAKSLQVEAIVRSKLSIAEKLVKIATIDARDEGEAPTHGNDKPKKTIVSDPRPIAKEKSSLKSDLDDGLDKASLDTEKTQGVTSTGARQAKRNRSRFIVEPHSVGIFAYFFRHQGLIRSYGESMQTITRGSFPFTLKADPQSQIWFNKNLKENLISVLLDGIPPLLRRGWLHIDKNSYNRLSAFYNLVLDISRTNYQLQKVPHDRIVLPFKALAPHVLVFFSDKNSPKQLSQIVETARRALGLEIERYNLVQEALGKFFGKNDKSQTIASLLLSLWMLQSHRFVELSEMIPANHASFFPEGVFDCSQEVQIEIDRHIGQLVKRLENLSLLFHETLRLHFFIPAESGLFLNKDTQEIKYSAASKIDFSVLEQFCNEKKPPKEVETNNLMPSFSRTHDSIAQWALDFCDHFINSFSGLLAGSVNLQSRRKLVLFQTGVIPAQISRIKLIVDRLGNASATLANFTQHRYNQLIMDVKKSEGPELNVLACLQELHALYGGLGKALADFIRLRCPSAPAQVRGSTQADQELKLPEENETIEGPAELAGLQTVEALIVAARLSLLASIRLGETAIVFEWQKVDGLKDEADSLVRELVQIARRDEVDSILERFYFINQYTKSFTVAAEAGSTM